METSSVVYELLPFAGSSGSGGVKGSKFLADSPNAGDYG
jgi:hypothetical protein